MASPAPPTTPKLSASKVFLVHLSAEEGRDLESVQARIRPICSERSQRGAKGGKEMTTTAAPSHTPPNLSTLRRMVASYPVAAFLVMAFAFGWSAMLPLLLPYQVI